MTSGSSTAKAAPTPAPSHLQGNISQTVPAGTIRTAAPIAATATATFVSGVTAKLAHYANVDATARIPGELAGPATSLTIEIDNNSRSAISVANVVVNVQDAAGLPFSPLTTSNTPFAGSIAAGKHATGTYVFHQRQGFSNPLTISVSYSTAAPVIQFIGAAA